MVVTKLWLQRRRDVVERLTRPSGNKGLVVMKKDIRETRFVRLGSMINEEKKSGNKIEEKGTGRNTREEIRKTRSCPLNLG